MFKADKVDLLIGTDSTETCLGYLAEAKHLGLRLSLRTQCATPPPDLKALKDAGLLDVYLTPDAIVTDGLEQWFHAAREAEVPVRIQVPLAFPDHFDVTDYAEHLALHGVKVLHLCAHDSFLPDYPTTSAHALNTCAGLIKALETLHVDAHILQVPFCHLDESLWPYAVNDAQFFSSHQHYIKSAYTLAQQLYPKGSIIASKVLQMTLGKHTLFNDPIDNKLLPWLLENPWLRARVVAWHRLTRHLRLTRAVPKPLEVNSEAEAEQALELKATETRAALGDTCSQCALRVICNHDAPRSAIEGDLVTSPLHFTAGRKSYCDEVDEARYALPARQNALAAAARTVVDNFPPTLEIDSLHYRCEDQWCHQLPGGVRWYGFTNSEKRSTPLATLAPPFTLSYVAGGGIAEYAGFSLGRDCTLLCPMESYQHTLTLHVAEEGDYVLLRDGLPVSPIHFEGHGSVPLRLGTPLSPRISLWNIDQSLVTQNVKLWGGMLPDSTEPKSFRYSIVTVSVRYARRLQLMLQSIVHQQGIDLAAVEIIVAYVPDVDATEDVLDSIALAHPDLSIRRVTFTEDKAKAKGFIINECIDTAQGDWVVLLDADTLLPPTLLSEVENQADEVHYLVPDGRKLLSPKTTAQVLLGNQTPWDDWDSLLSADGEMRHREMDGVPIGFCQIVRRSCFEQVRYYEAEHFEGADWQFSVEMRKVFGTETRLSGTPVLHLDHGGSNWYGTTRHY